MTDKERIKNLEKEIEYLKGMLAGMRTNPIPYIPYYPPFYVEPNKPFWEQHTEIIC